MSLDERSKKMCRVCLSTEEKYSQLFFLFSGGCAASEVPKKMMNISNVAVHEEDGLPSMICQKCLFLVKVTDCFKRQLQMSDKVLRKTWFETKENKSSSPLHQKSAVDSSGSELEDLAYNPDYISDEIQAEVEKAFRKKQEMHRNKDYKEILKLLQNLGKKKCHPPDSLKKEIVQTEKSDDSIEKNNPDFDTPDSIQNGDSSNDKIVETINSKIINSEKACPDMKSETTDIIKMEDPLIDTTKKPLESEESRSYPEALKTETEIATDCNEKESMKPSEPATERNIDEENVDPNVIVISDTSDEEKTKLDEKTSQKAKNDISELCLRRKKKKTIAPLLKKAIATETPRIQVRKIYQTLQVVKTRKTQSKAAPRTYFLCTSCNVRLKSVADVLLHHNEVHSPNKNCPHCRMCNKTFPTKSELLAHFNEHVETHLFRCSYCPNEFVRKDNLTRHMLNHTEASSGEPENKRIKINNENSTEEKKIEKPENEIGNFQDNDFEKKSEFTCNS